MCSSYRLALLCIRVRCNGRHASLALEGDLKGLDCSLLVVLIGADLLDLHGQGVLVAFTALVSLG